ncbi:thrombospondin type-1 domain-containing protein 1 [Rhinophrynus dorsalis]
MKQILRGLTCISLVVLWDCAFGEPDYLLLRRSQHSALSRDPVFVDYFLPYNHTIMTSNISITLLDANNNQTVTKKYLAVNQSQGGIEFECYHFVSAGLYQFQINLHEENSSNINWRSSILNVTWPVFHIYLNRSAKDMLRSFQIGVFTNELLCSGFPDKDPTILMEVEHTHSFQELEEPTADRFMLYKTYKEIPLSPSQWVEFECASVRPEAFIMVSLKPMFSDSVIAFLGPVDLVKTFNYKLTPALEQKCDSLVSVHVLPPPCNYAQGRMIVYKEAPRSPMESVTILAEKVLQTGDKASQFNCTLFDIGRNKYCFEFSMFSSKMYSFPRAKECVAIRREIETWGLWQSWSPCSATCGDGQRERYRECLTTSTTKPGCNGSPKETSFCSLVDCSTVKPSGKSTTHSTDDAKTSNTVTIAGISLCLIIIMITIVITVWRKLHKDEKCSTTVKHNSTHSVSCRKNSDEENIYQVRESFCDFGEVLQENIEETVHIPLTYRKTGCVAEEQVAPENDSSQTNVQKIIPPIFSYRLAQQQLKEMKQKGLTEATKVYHVSQNPMADTALDASLTPPLIMDNSDETAPNKFHIKSPFIEPRNVQTHCHGERPNSKCAFPPFQGMSPSQTLPRLSYLKNQDTKARHFERGYHKNNFRRTSSFHETKHYKPHRERSLTTLSPRQTMTYNPRTRTWEYSTVERSRHKSIRTDKSPENLIRGANVTIDATTFSTKNPYMWPVESKPDIVCSRQLSARATRAERPEQNKCHKGPSPVDKSWNKVQEFSNSPKEDYQRKSSLSHSEYRREKCQSFPWGTDCSFYDNSMFKLTEAEQQMIDLPGYFASNEEDETSTLSVERLVI